jgi:hypothetical protein
LKHWSKEADFFAKSLPVILAIGLVIRIPLIVCAAVTIVEVICYTFREVFEDFGVKGDVGIATYIVYPVLLLARLILALVSTVIQLFLGGGLIIGVSWLVAAGIAYVLNENALVYAFIMSGLLKAAAVGISMTADVFTTPLVGNLFGRLQEKIEAMNEGVLVLTWFVVVGITIVVTLFTPLFLPFVDIQQQFGWPFLQLR